MINMKRNIIGAIIIVIIFAIIFLIAFNKPQQVMSYTVRVLDSNNNPIQNATVSAYSGVSNILSVKTNSNGYAVLNLNSNNYIIKISAFNYMSTTALLSNYYLMIKLNSTQTNPEKESLPGNQSYVSYHIYVEDSNTNAPISNANVSVYTSDNRFVAFNSTNSKGVTTINLTPDSYNIEVNATNYFSKLITISNYSIHICSISACDI